jgi:hypothetical protein
MPACTSVWLLKQAHSYLAYLWDANCEVFLPNQFDAPATMIQAFVNGTIGARLPLKEWWIQAYSDDTKMSAIRDLVTNPSKINNEALSMVNSNHWAPLRNSQIVLEDGLLIYQNQSPGVLPTPACNLFWLRFITSSSSLFTQMPSEGT